MADGVIAGIFARSLRHPERRRHLNGSVILSEAKDFNDYNQMLRFAQHDGRYLAPETIYNELQRAWWAAQRPAGNTPLALCPNI